MMLERIGDFTSLYSTELICGLIVGFLLLIIWIIQTRRRVKMITKKYDDLVSDTGGINLEDVLTVNQRSISKLSEELKMMEKKFSSLEIKQTYAIQKVGFIRYNAFSDVGNELSYSIALLDGHDSGFVLSSLYNRDDSVSYSKSLKNGKSKIPLSTEEKIAIDRALKGENVEKAV